MPHDKTRTTVRDGKIIRLKVCSGCGLEKVCEAEPDTEFRVNRKWDDGRPRWWDARCKECRRERERERWHSMSPAQKRGRKQRALPNRLPIAPFQAWLVAYMRAVGVDHYETVGFELGIVPRRVREYVLGNQPLVSTGVVDRALTEATRFVDVNDKTIFTITDLYGDYLNARKKAA